jgi:hypothetical protein
MARASSCLQREANYLRDLGIEAKITVEEPRLAGYKTTRSF